MKKSFLCRGNSRQMPFKSKIAAKPHHTFVILLSIALLMGLFTGCAYIGNTTSFFQTANISLPFSNSIQDNGTKKLLFMSDREGGSNFYTINEDGTGIRKLTNFQDIELYKDYETEPIIISAWIGPDKNYHIYGMDDDGRLICLSDNNTDDYNAVSSPDKMKIVYWHECGYPAKGLYVMNSDGSNRVKVFDHCSDAYWSPNSRYLAAVDDDKHIIYVIDAYKNTKWQIDSGELPDSPWSPDSKSIIFENNGVESVNIETRLFVKIAQKGYQFSRWTNQNKIVLFKGNSIYTVNDNGFNLRPILQLENTNIIDTNWSSDNSACVVICKDGKYEGYAGYEDKIDGCKLSFLIFDNSGQLKDSGNIATGSIYEYMQWSPNSSKYIFFTSSVDKIYINAFDVKSRQTSTQLLGIYNGVGSYYWSKDGSYFTFSADNYQNNSVPDGCTVYHI